MRPSRKAGLFARGVQWAKYECHYTWDLDYARDYGDLVEEEISEEEYLRSNTGYGTYQIKYNYNTEQVYFVPSGELITGTGRMLWNISADGQTATGVSVRIDRQGSSTGYERATRIDRILRTYRYYYYEVSNMIGYIRAEDGKYPDEKNGYTYVTTYAGYTIMKDGDGEYYAYKEANKE